MYYLAILAVTAMLGGGAYVATDHYIDAGAETNAEVTTDMRVEGSSASEMEAHEDTDASLMTRLGALLRFESETASKTEADTNVSADADASVNADTSVDAGADTSADAEARGSGSLDLSL